MSVFFGNISGDVPGHGRHVGAAPRSSAADCRRPSPAWQTPHGGMKADRDGCSDHARAPCGCGHRVGRRCDRGRFLESGLRNCLACGKIVLERDVGAGRLRSALTRGARRERGQRPTLLAELRFSGRLGTLVGVLEAQCAACLRWATIRSRRGRSSLAPHPFDASRSGEFVRSPWRNGAGGSPLGGSGRAGRVGRVEACL